MIRWTLLALLLSSCAHYEQISYLDVGEKLLPEGSNIYVVGNASPELKDKARDTLNQSQWLIAKSAPDLELKIESSEAPKISLHNAKLKKNVKMERAFYLQISEFGEESTARGSVSKNEGSDDTYHAYAETVVTALVSLIDPQKNILLDNKVQIAKGIGRDEGQLPKAPGKSSLRPIVYGLLLNQKLPRESAQDQLKWQAEAESRQKAIQNLNQELAAIVAPCEKVVRMKFDKDAPEYSEFRELYEENKFDEAIALNQQFTKDEDYWRSLRNNAIVFEKLGDYLNARLSWDQSIASCPARERDCQVLKERYAMFVQRESALQLIKSNSAKKVSTL